ncbi:MAG: endonuclease/exonuclease/phosphatase family protein [Candidatus Devosia symbiotica]|nr:endonuclease/exonuclease/phosphatase family protein [Candidatus Devosia symbiotica]
MTILLQTIRLCLVSGAFLAASLSIAGLFGFAMPVLDLLNHAQILLFPTTLVGLAIVALALRGALRSVAVIYAFVGFATSANVIVPEFVAALRARLVAPTTQTVKMMTHNLFGLNYDMAQVVAAFRSEDTDIIVLQEYFGEQTSDLHSRLLKDYPYFVRCRGGKRANLGLYSRIPFEQVQDHACPDNAYVMNRTGHILVRFTVPGDKPFSVLTTHMDWPLPVARQREQLAALSAVVADIEGPLIVAGDFNSTPWSYALRDFVASNGLVRETVNLVTYPMRFFYFDAWRDMIPFLPLDHVMTRGGVVVYELHAGHRTASDHLPVVFSFSVP